MHRHGLMHILLCMSVLCFLSLSILMWNFTPAISEHSVKNVINRTIREIVRQKKSRRFQKWGIDIDAFLERYGYLHENSDDARESRHTGAERKEALRMYQEFHGLKQTGKMNKKVLKKMLEPRCSYPDVNLAAHTSRIWGFHLYHYCKKTFRDAFEVWTNVSGIRIIYTSKTSDIEIQFVRGNHGDGVTNSFQEKGQEAAHAYGPGPYLISGDIHFNDDAAWTFDESPVEGLNLFAVAVHQVGHSLGLHHSPEVESVMAPSFGQPRLRLLSSDIDQVQKLYGPNPDMREAPVEVFVPSTTTPAPKVCKVSMDDMDLGPDGRGYIFKHSYLRRIEHDGEVSRKREIIATVYEGGPEEIDAVAYNHEKERTYLFQNNTVWRYNRFKLDRGYPKRIVGRVFPEKPRSAAFLKDQYDITRLFIFGATQFYVWNPVLDMVASGYPRNTTEYWEGLPKAPKAATSWKDGYLYFIHAENYYKADPGTYKILPGYPKPMPPPWMKGVC
ncbi:hypothetical protein ACJMK2_006925 [Sinanodonta woodiana]|uniref:Peptidase metallopeptidase domain-containing protein n=1 Tax=Sinanodonta woodiana TaxID=1069815 RepID=A0ABD3VUQ9_SINWO